MLVLQQGYIGGYPGVSYNPRLDFVFQEEMSVSLTTYPTIAANSQMGYFAVHMPVLAQFNFGNHASSDAEMPIGFFGGAGYSFGAYSDAGPITGPCFSAGIKFGGERSYGLRFEMVRGKENGDDRDKIYTLSFIYNFLR